LLRGGLESPVKLPVNHAAKLLIESGFVLPEGNETIISAGTDEKILAGTGMSQAFAEISNLLYTSEASLDVKRPEAVKAGAR